LTANETPSVPLRLFMTLGHEMPCNVDLAHITDSIDVVCVVVYVHVYTYMHYVSYVSSRI